MSRAFVKERDEPEPRLPAGPLRPITPAGYQALRAHLALETDERERAEIERILANVSVGKPPKNRSRIGFGAVVSLEHGPAESTFEIVGEDEVDIARGKIGHLSPLAQALMGKRSGMVAIWRRPIGDRKVRIVGVRYHADPAEPG